MGKQKKAAVNPQGDRLVYSEFGNASYEAAMERAVPDLPPNQQDLRIQVSRKGRKGKTVTVVSGFQSSAATLSALCKTLKAQCGAGGAVKENTIEIQGDHAQTLLKALQAQAYRVKISGG